MHNLTRREFVRHGAVALAGAALASCDSPTAPDDTPGALGKGGAPKRVAVIGAGLSGLVAAYELSRAGHEVTVLEGQTRVGGRVLTLRTPFSDGHFAEAGAARIPPEHDLTLGYARHFGLELDPFYPREGTFVEYAGGQRTDRSASEFLSARPDFVKIRGGNGPAPEGVCRGTRGFEYRASTRVFVQFRQRFWEAEGFNGWGITDWPEELWHPTWDRPGPRGVLLSYVRGGRALELASSPWRRAAPGAGTGALE